MSLIDRYLLRQFFWIWFICFCSLTGLYCVIDAFGNIEEFLNFAEKTHTSLWSLLGEYYSYRALAFFDRTSGILTLIAAMFTLANLQRYNEFTALQAAGVSKRRIVRPLVLMALCISLSAALLRETVIPNYRNQFTRTAQDLSKANTVALNSNSTSGAA